MSRTDIDPRGADPPAADRPRRKRIASLAQRAARERVAFAPPDDPPDPDRAMRYCREGLGPALAPYLDARTGGALEAFAPSDHRRLRGAVNDYLALYAACHGVECDPAFPLQAVASVFVETRNVWDTARVLTDVPQRGASGSGTKRPTATSGQGS
jgi:hypothetical protein